MVMPFLHVRAQYDSHAPNILSTANLDFDDLNMAALAMTKKQSTCSRVQYVHSNHNSECNSYRVPFNSGDNYISNKHIIHISVYLYTKGSLHYAICAVKFTTRCACAV